MLRIEQPYIDLEGNEHNDLIRFYSSAGKKLLQVDTGTLYYEAIDPYPTSHSYIESDIDREEIEQ